MPQAILECQISSGWSVERVEICMHYDDLCAGSAKGTPLDFSLQFIGRERVHCPDSSVLRISMWCRFAADWQSGVSSARNPTSCSGVPLIRYCSVS
jgi:hypothetical protein